MIKPHQALVQSQFGSQAQAYVESPVHSQGADLEFLDEVLQQKKPHRALDMGTGGGHVAYLMASHAEAVVAADLSEEVLAVVGSTAINKGIFNLTTQQCPAEELPFDDSSFDFLASRFSAHHWSDLEKGLSQCHRVLQRNAPAVFIDICSSGIPLFDTHLQAIELLRDTSHVRDYSPAEWMAALTRNGFSIDSMRRWRLRMDFDSWVARMRTPEDAVAVIRYLQRGASQEVRSYFEIENDGSFLLDAVLFQTTAM